MLVAGRESFGSMIKKHHPKADVTMTDIHAMAIQSARQTLAENQLEGPGYRKRCVFPY